MRIYHTGEKNAPSSLYHCDKIIALSTLSGVFRRYYFGKDINTYSAWETVVANMLNCFMLLKIGDVINK